MTAHAPLELENQRLKKALENAIAGIVVTNSEGLITFVNNKWLEIFEYTNHRDVLEKHVEMFFSQNVFDKEIIPLISKLQENTIQATEITGIKSDDSETILFLKVTKIPDGISWYILDLTVQKENEEKLKKAQANYETEKKHTETLELDIAKFHLAVESAADHIVITDKDGIIVYTNPAAERITGFNLKEIIGKKAGSNELWGGQMKKEVYEQLWQTIKIDKRTYSGKFKNKRKNGNVYIADVHISPILDSDGEVQMFVGIERDITEEETAKKLKTEFISLASHQLRTPLSAIKWYSEILLGENADNLNTSQREYLNNINESNERMIELTTALLNVSRMESGRVIIDPKPTNLEKTVKEVIDELSIEFKQKNINVKLKTQKNLTKIPTDERLIRNVYLNLLDNAYKYTPKGGNIVISIFSKDNEIVSEIKDSGMGIPQQDQDKVFNKFFRAENANTSVTDGNGLGLYLAYAIVKASGGRLWFESQENKGSIFSFSLPITGSKAKEGEVTLDG